MPEQLVAFFTDMTINTGLRILGSLLFLFIGSKLIKVLVKIIISSKEFQKIELSIQTFFKSFITITLNVILFVTVAAILGVDTTSMLALLGSAGLAIGLALQGSLGNIAGGVMIMVFKHFKVGDYIDTHKDAGTVQEITIFYTTLLTPDNRKIILPNGQLSNSSIINFSAQDTRRVDLLISVSYNSNIDDVVKILLDLADSHEMVLKEPAPMARLKEHADSALVFVFRVWCKRTDYWTVYFDMMENTKKSFDKKGIEIPYPQMDVHMQNK